MRTEQDQAARAAHTRLIDLSLRDFIPALTPKYERPEHLKPITDFFDRVNRGEVVRMLCSAPPQFTKSETMTHGCAQTIARSPEKPIIYASYDAKLAEAKSLMARDYARACGVELRTDKDAIGDWLTPEGGGMRARGIGGGTTGNPAKVLVIDDPHKDRADAESALMRQRAIDWYTSVAETRCHPDSSILVAHARWHEEDLIGQLKELKNADGSAMFEYYNLPAILPNGEPLWHERPLHWLESKKQFEHDWWSLWMGSPRTRGNRAFKGIHYYDSGKLPIHYRIGKGLDLAASSKKTSCWSVGLVLLEDIDAPRDELGFGTFYVVDVRRKQEEPRLFRTELQSIIWPGAYHWFTSTTEKGTAALLEDLGVPIEAVLASTDKLDRAQPAIAAWNRGRILVPREAPWLREFVDELGSFTGVNDKGDDQVDALASAYEGVRYRTEPAKTVSGAGSRYGEERGFG